MSGLKTREIALAGLMTALTMVVTRAFIIQIPQTRGYFNIGETAVYMTAILFGPKIGAVAGGVGSALADISLGFSAFAPFTLVIKGVEGFVVGTLARGHHGGIAAGGAVIGLLLGVWVLTLDNWLVRTAGAAVIVAAVASLALIYWRQRQTTGIRLAAMISGGFIMVLGYFVTQAYIMRLGAGPALVEVPYNVVQVAAGIVAGLLAAETFEEAILAAQR